MISHRCGLSRSQFVELSHGLGGPVAVAALTDARFSRTLLLLKYVADESLDARAAFDLIRWVGRRAPNAVRTVLRHPTVGAWLTRVVAEHRARGVDRTAELAFVAAAAALRAGVSATVDLPAGERIPLPSLGIGTGTVLGGPTAVAELEWAQPARIVLDDTDVELSDWAPVWRPTELTSAQVTDRDTWQRRFSACWALLTAGHPGVAAELRAAISMITPLPSVAGTINSATLADAYGCVFLSMPTDAEQLGVTLTHELQHTKLVGLLDLYPLLRPDNGEKFYAPWRTDPRPAHGLLHGCYAYVGVTGFWRRQAARTGSQHAQREFARWRADTLDATRTLLDSGSATELGTLFLTGMVDVLGKWCTEAVSDSAAADAAQQSGTHRDRWSHAHGND